MLWSNLMPPRRRPRTQTDSEPCGAPSCNRLVTNHSGGVQCSECPTWFHIRCGGFSRAVQIPEHWQCPLCSSTGLTEAIENLQITTESSGTSGTVTANVVKTAILSFPAGSAGGTTGMCPQTLKDLISPSNGDAGTRLLEKLTEFVNLVLSGNLRHAYDLFSLVQIS